MSLAVVQDQISRRSDRPLVESTPGGASVLLGAHMPGLDLLRGIAVLMVVIYHPLWFDASGFVWHNGLARTLFRLTSIGWTGVNLFFALSGFLITGNLLDSLGKQNFYTRFYVRRALRIVPIYYVMILILATAGEMSWNCAGACFLFVANMPALVVHSAWWGVFPAWSLGVEEQFYLTWPLFVRVFRRNRLMVLCVAAMVLCPLLRWVAFDRLISAGDIFSKPWMIGDNLAVGALLAGMLRTPGVTLRAVRYTALIAGAGSTGVLLYLSAHVASLKQNVWGVTLGYSCLELLCGSVLVFALMAFRQRRLPRPLRPFEFLADISYGLYLIHMACAQWYDHIFGLGYLRDGRALLLRFVVVTGAAVMLAAVSKRYFENPIMELRRRIPAAQ